MPDWSVVGGPRLEDVPPHKRAALLVALLFTSGERVESARLAEFLQVERSELLALAEEAAGSLRRLGLDILPAAGGLKLVSSAELDPFIAEYHRDVRKSRLSRSALEVLAIVAYEQPVSRAQIDDIRAVNSESTVRALLDRRLIAVAGRAETPGRPFLYRSTDAFLEVFGLGALDDLPPRPATLRSSAAAEEGDLGPFAAESEEEVGADPASARGATRLSSRRAGP